LTARLRELEKAGQLEGHVAISNFLPSATRQEKDRRLLAPLILDEQGLLARVAKRVGLSEGLREAYVKEFTENLETPPVGLEAWLAHPVSEPYRHLWIGQTERGVFGVVSLRGVFDLAALKAVADAEPEIHFIDPAGEISDLFADYRREAGWLAFISYLLVALLLVVRYRVLGGLAIIAPPALAAFTSLGVLGLLGQPISLFNVMALLLVLGIGVDYGLFFRETGMVHASTFLAIAMSALTTLLAFGLLAFSRTAAISAFGLTILIGICVAFLLSPMAGTRVMRNPD
jgi:predicted exporter